MRKLTFLFCFLSILLLLGQAYAVDVTTENYRDVYKIHAEWFTAYDPENATDYVYNESGDTSATAGELDTSWVWDKGNILVYIPTFGAATVTVRIEGKTKGSTVWSNIYTKTYNTAMTIAENFPITTYFDALRVGALVSQTLEVESLTVEGDFIKVKRK